MNMKKILLLAFVSIIALGASAQLASPISLGVHGGWASTKIDTKSLSVGNDVINDISSSATGGYMLGIFTRINLGKLYIQPELNYSRKSGSVEMPYENTTTLKMGKILSDLTYSSIDIPLLLGYKIIKLPFVNVHVFAGPVASFSTSALEFNVTDIKDLATGDGDTFESSANKNFNPKKAMWNIKMGAGLEVWKLNLDVDYEMGLREFNKDIKAPQIFNLTIGFRFI